MRLLGHLTICECSGIVQKCQATACNLQHAQVAAWQLHHHKKSFACDNMEYLLASMSHTISMSCAMQLVKPTKFTVHSACAHVQRVYCTHPQSCLAQPTTTKAVHPSCLGEP